MFQRFPAEIKSFMKKELLLNSENVESILNELLKLYSTSNLTANSDYGDYSKVAAKFVKNLDEASKQYFRNEEFFADSNSISIPKGLSTLDKQDFIFGLENLYYTVRNSVNNYKPSLIELKTERQASPPVEVYDLVGHNADINVKKMSYSYLYD